MNKEVYKYVSNEDLAKSFAKEFAQTNEPISISFRSLFSDLNRIDRYSHLIHTYPAKLLVHIPYFFLNNEFFSKKGDTILDPFCGTGTVLLEANIAGRNALGADSNPLARLIASVKTTKLDKAKLQILLAEIISKTILYDNVEYPNVVNRDFWFSKSTQQYLAKIRKAILELTSNEYQYFFEVCFSNCIKKVSFADPRIAVPVKLNPSRFEQNIEQFNKIKNRISDLENIDVISKFKTICEDNIARIDKLNTLENNVSSRIISSNAKRLTSSLDETSLLVDNCIDLIITSPPYAGAQKYIRSSSLNLGWLGVTENESLKNLDRKSIGRENYSKAEIKEIETEISSADRLLAQLFKINSERAFIVGNYLQEMKSAIDESIRVLKKEGYLIIIIGNNKVCDMEFNTQKYITEYIEKKNLKLEFKLIDDIKSYGLMTKRNKTADIISREWILVFKK